MESLSRRAGKAPRPMSSRSSNNISTFVMPPSANACHRSAGQRLVGFEQDFAGLAVDDVGDAVSAFESRQGPQRNLGDLGLDEFP